MGARRGSSKARLQDVFVGGRPWLSRHLISRIFPRDDNGSPSRANTRASLVDDRVLIPGPANATHNGLENSYEVVAKVEGPRPRKQYSGIFAALWEVATPVDWAVLCEGLRSNRRWEPRLSRTALGFVGAATVSGAQTAPRESARPALRTKASCVRLPPQRRVRGCMLGFQRFCFLAPSWAAKPMLTLPVESGASRLDRDIGILPK